MSETLIVWRKTALFLYKKIASLWKSSVEAPRCSFGRYSVALVSTRFFVCVRVTYTYTLKSNEGYSITLLIIYLNKRLLC